MDFGPDEALNVYFAFVDRMQTTKWPRHYLKRAAEHPVSNYELQAQAEAEMAKLTAIVNAGIQSVGEDQACLPDDFPDAMRRWLQAYIQPDAWKRYLAARRQRNAKRRRREGQYDEDIASLPLTCKSISALGTLAKQSGLNKRQLVHNLARYLSVTPSGQKAFSEFVNWHRSS